MAKCYQKDCKNLKEVNSFLRKCNLHGWEIENEQTNDFDFDSWINEEETKGLSVQVTLNYEVYITKYTKKDIEEIEKTL